MALNLSGTSGITGAGIGTIGPSGANVTGVGTFTQVEIDDKIIHVGDTNTAIRFPAADTITAETGGTERLRITSAGLIQAKTRSAEVRRMILSGSPSNASFNIESHDGETGTSSGDIQGKLGLFYNDGSTLANTACLSFERGSSSADGALSIITNNTARLYISSTGQVRIGDGAASDYSISNDANAVLQLTSATTPKAVFIRNDTSITDGDHLGLIDFHSRDGGPVRCARIGAVASGTHATDDNPTDLIFRTCPDGSASDAERVRIDAAGNVGINNTSPAYKLDAAASGTVVSRFRQNTNDEAATAACTIYRHAAATGGTTAFVVLFQNASGSTVGSIKSNTSATAFNTSSDYRLKENEELISNGIERLKTLKPYRFNFKEDPSTTVDGFFAHEAQEVVPYVVSGEKDGEDMQGIDYGKLTPLLTAALQEAIVEIETLKTKVAALESA